MYSSKNYIYQPQKHKMCAEKGAGFDFFLGKGTKRLGLFTGCHGTFGKKTFFLKCQKQWFEIRLHTKQLYNSVQMSQVHVKVLKFK